MSPLYCVNELSNLSLNGTTYDASPCQPSVDIPPPEETVPLPTPCVSVPFVSAFHNPVRLAAVPVSSEPQPVPDVESGLGVKRFADPGYTNGDAESAPHSTRPRHTLSPSRSAAKRKSGRPARDHRYSPYTSPLSTPASSHGSDELPPTPGTPPSGAGSPARRIATLKHTSARTEQFGDAPGRTADALEDAPDSFQCPYCDYVQASGRMAELKRHVARHFPNLQHVCRGVRAGDAHGHEIAADLGEAAEWDGELRVGGCWQVFSRRDALLRHLHNDNVRCVTDMDLSGSKRKATAPKKTQSKKPRKH
jgi:hypothetical protein